MKLKAFILLSNSLYLTTAFTGSSLVIDTKRNPFESSTGNRYGTHVQVRTQSSYAISPESAEYQESIQESFTAVTNHPSTKNNNNNTSVLTGINVLQACTAGLCVAGRLPILNGVLSLVVGKGLFVAGLAIMGLAWNITRNDEGENKLITTGIYSRVRHPFLAGQWMALIGFAGCWNIKQSPMRYFLAGLYYLVLRKKIEIEEKKLEKQFGHEYQVYKVLVKGQLIPMGISSMFNTE